MSKSLSIAIKLRHKEGLFSRLYTATPIYYLTSIVHKMWNFWNIETELRENSPLNRKISTQAEQHWQPSPFAKKTPTVSELCILFLPDRTIRNKNWQWAGQQGSLFTPWSLWLHSTTAAGLCPISSQSLYVVCVLGGHLGRLLLLQINFQPSLSLLNTLISCPIIITNRQDPQHSITLVHQSISHNSQVSPIHTLHTRKHK